MGAVIGIMGGTFDPPHLAHAVLADEALHTLELDRILWVPTAHPPHKPDRPISAVEHRIAMVELLTGSDENFELSRADLDRKPPHYAVGTMEWLRARHPETQLAYIMGSDSLRDLPSWHEPRTFVELCDCIGVMGRKDAVVDLDELERSLPGVSDKLIFFEVPLLQISGFEIRNRIQQQGAYRYFLHPDVVEYIRLHELYR